MNHHYSIKFGLLINLLSKDNVDGLFCAKPFLKLEFRCKRLPFFYYYKNYCKNRIWNSNWLSMTFDFTSFLCLFKPYTGWVHLLGETKKAINLKAIKTTQRIIFHPFCIVLVCNNQVFRQGRRVPNVPNSGFFFYSLFSGRFNSNSAPNSSRDSKGCWLSAIVATITR